MERVWAVSACLAAAGVWWAGFGGAWWRKYHVSPGWAAMMSALMGCCQWIPSVRGVALGDGALALALGGMLWRLGRPGVGRALAVAVLALVALQIFPGADQTGQARVCMAVLVGLAGAWFSRDPLEALIVTACGLLLTEFSLAFFVDGDLYLRTRSGLALVVLGALAAWTLRMLSLQSTALWHAGRRKQSKKQLTKP